MELKFTIDSKAGNPYFEFTHHDKENDLLSKSLELFIKKAKAKGIKLTNPSGHIGNGESLEIYNIEIK